MIITQSNRIARAALLAMEIIVTPTNSADPTIITMKLLFPRIIIEEFADFAEIFPHSNTTVSANLSNWLFCVTNRTNNLFNILTNKFMAIKRVFQHTRCLVMTMTA
jgi:hypothetical protein